MQNDLKKTIGTATKWSTISELLAKLIDARSFWGSSNCKCDNQFC